MEDVHQIPLERVSENINVKFFVFWAYFCDDRADGFDA